MKYSVPKYLLAALLLCLSQALAQTADDARPLVTYSVSLSNADHHVVHVSVGVKECTGDAESTASDPTQRGCDMQLPVWNALYQVRDFAQYVRNVTAKNLHQDPIAVRVTDKTTWNVSIGGAPFEFDYDIAADTSGPFGAHLSKDHAFFNLAQLLMYPVQQRTARATVRFTDIPAGWRIATSLRHFTDNTFTAKSYDQMVDSPVELGSFAEADFDVGGAKYRVAVDADPSDYDLQSITDIARKIAVTEVEWMDDRPFDHYLFIFHFPRHPAGGGMEHAYSTAIDASADRVKSNPLSLAGVTAHEFFHLWNVKRIRPQSLEPVDYTKEQYTRALWFSEGVTSTVAAYMRVRAGFLDETGFLAELASEIRQLESRPARLTQSVEESSLDAWLEKYPPYESPQRSISYYNKGEIVGMMLDLQMREASAGKKSLRDLFHWMNDHYARQGKFFPDSRGVEEAAEGVTGADFHEFFARYVAGVDPIPYDQFFASVGLRLDKQSIVVPDPGFRTLRRTANLVVSVNSGSAAEKAGLRAGDIIQQINGRAPGAAPGNELMALHIGDTVELRVSGAGGSRRVKFKLAGTPGENYSLVEREGASEAQRARRAAWMRGESE